jgi:hypothetical protein
MFSDGEKSDGESSGRKPAADPSPDRGSGPVAAREQTPGEIEHDVHHRTSTDSRSAARTGKEMMCFDFTYSFYLFFISFDYF